MFLSSDNLNVRHNELQRQPFMIIMRHSQKVEENQQTGLLTGHDPTRGPGYQVSRLSRVESGRIGRSHETARFGSWRRF